MATPPKVVRPWIAHALRAVQAVLGSAPALARALEEKQIQVFSPEPDYQAFGAWSAFDAAVAADKAEGALDADALLRRYTVWANFCVAGQEGLHDPEDYGQDDFYVLLLGTLSPSDESMQATFRPLSKARLQAFKPAGFRAGDHLEDAYMRDYYLKPTPRYDLRLLADAVAKATRPETLVETPVVVPVDMFGELRRRRAQARVRLGATGEEMDALRPTLSNSDREHLGAFPPRFDLDVGRMLRLLESELIGPQEESHWDAWTVAQALMVTQAVTCFAPQGFVHWLEHEGPQPLTSHSVEAALAAWSPTMNERSPERAADAAMTRTALQMATTLLTLLVARKSPVLQTARPLLDAFVLCERVLRVHETRVPPGVTNVRCALTGRMLQAEEPCRVVDMLVRFSDADEDVEPHTLVVAHRGQCPQGARLFPLPPKKRKRPAEEKKAPTKKAKEPPGSVWTHGTHPTLAAAHLVARGAYDWAATYRDAVEHARPAEVASYRLALAATTQEALGEWSRATGGVEKLKALATVVGLYFDAPERVPVRSEKEDPEADPFEAVLAKGVPPYTEHALPESLVLHAVPMLVALARKAAARKPSDPPPRVDDVAMNQTCRDVFAALFVPPGQEGEDTN